MTTNPIDDLAKQLAAEAERQRLEAEAKAAGSAPALTPEAIAALEKFTRTLAEARPEPLPAQQPAGGTERAPENKKSH